MDFTIEPAPGFRIQEFVLNPDSPNVDKLKPRILNTYVGTQTDNERWHFTFAVPPNKTTTIQPIINGTEPCQTSFNNWLIWPIEPPENASDPYIVYGSVGVSNLATTKDGAYTLTLRDEIGQEFTYTVYVNNGNPPVCPSPTPTPSPEPTPTSPGGGNGGNNGGGGNGGNGGNNGGGGGTPSPSPIPTVPPPGNSDEISDEDCLLGNVCPASEDVFAVQSWKDPLGLNKFYEAQRQNQEALNTLERAIIAERLILERIENENLDLRTDKNTKKQLQNAQNKVNRAYIAKIEKRRTMEQSFIKVYEPDSLFPCQACQNKVNEYQKRTDYGDLFERDIRESYNNKVAPIINYNEDVFDDPQTRKQKRLEIDMESASRLIEVTTNLEPDKGNSQQQLDRLIIEAQKRSKAVEVVYGINTNEKNLAKIEQKYGSQLILTDWRWIYVPVSP